MYNNYYKKGIVIGIILIFISAGFFPIISGYDKKQFSDNYRGNIVTKQLNDYTNITVYEAWDLLNDTTNGIQIPVDVRKDYEWEAGFINTPYPESPIHYCLDLLEEQSGLEEFIDLYDGKEVIFYCAKGGRSWVATQILVDSDFAGTIYNMVGGTTAWKTAGLPMRTNDPPEPPDIQGPGSGKKKTYYDFILNSQDPDEDGVKYFIDWGDGNTEWTDFSESGQPLIVNHAWDKQGTYTTIFRAQDYYGAESDNSTGNMIIPKNKILNFANINMNILDLFFKFYIKYFQQNI